MENIETTTEVSQVAGEKSLTADNQKLAEDIIKETDPNKIRNLIQIFNQNLSKKNATRLLTLDTLLDHVTDQMGIRLEKLADEFSNEDLIKYLKVLQESKEKSIKMLNQVDETPVINFTSNTVNIGGENSTSLDRESRERVMDAVAAYLKRIQQEPEVYVGEFTEATTDEEEESININSSEETDV